MKGIVAALIFFLVTLAVMSESVCQYPGEPLTHRLDAELRQLTHIR